ncbi:hypothetical protein AAP_03807 [Ascosphaera apis ARSEF 7405]|uniref:Uncharacterized protein n=1 Tax=Ascosphaera apis ARSEF 7405 TaxID=392613 RepID=A0A167Y0P5_9EURO|nr:hypothetical protein AAP_03807 [Ascosphaera apis ARSEF 7405]
MDKIRLYDRGVISRSELQRYLRNMESDDDICLASCSELSSSTRSASSRSTSSRSSSSRSTSSRSSQKPVVRNHGNSSRGNNNASFNNCTFNGVDFASLRQPEQPRERDHEMTGPLMREHNVRCDATGRPIRQERTYYPPSGYDTGTLAYLESARLPSIRQTQDRYALERDEWPENRLAATEQYSSRRRRKDFGAEIHARVLS